MMPRSTTVAGAAVRCWPRSWLRHRRRIELAPLFPLGEEALVQRVQRRHVGLPELEVEDIRVLRDPLGAHALGQRHIAVLHRPANKHLRGRDAVGLCDAGENGVVEPEGARERRVRDDGDRALAAECSDVVLPEEGCSSTSLAAGGTLVFSEARSSSRCATPKLETPIEVVRPF